MNNRESFALVAIVLIAGVLFSPLANAQNNNDDVRDLRQQVAQLQLLVANLESRMATLENKNGPSLENAAYKSLRPGDAATLAEAASSLRSDSQEPAASQSSSPAQAVASAPAASPLPAILPGGATINYYFDGYFENNFNNPTGRANDLRAYDVLSRTFSINQAAIVIARDPDVQAGRRFGGRLDLQFGQATSTLQGNPANEPRPDIYRNIFQAYGTYIVPAGKGITVDFGKWASSLGIEGNYTKDQINYSRSFYFYYLPFYHDGARVHYDFNSKLGVNYWIVNGANQTEPVNGYKNELFGLTIQPTKTLSWIVNYFNGQEHPDTISASNCTVPVQPGLCFAPLNPAPNGKLHIFDSYATWNATPKLTFAMEGDYVIQREWANAAPGESSAPDHVDGGVIYAQYQPSARYAFGARSEYLSDRGGLFSNVTQALKEATGTYRYNFGDGFSAFLEYRRDWSNRLYFVTSNPSAPNSHQDTAGVGLVWWYGGKQGSW